MAMPVVAPTVAPVVDPVVAHAPAVHLPHARGHPHSPAFPLPPAGRMSAVAKVTGDTLARVVDAAPPMSEINVRTTIGADGVRTTNFSMTLQHGAPPAPATVGQYEMWAAIGQQTAVPDDDADAFWERRL